MAHLSLSFLGPLRITLDGRTVTTFRYDKVRALLAYVAVEADRPHRRDALTGLLWPELPEQMARNNLRQALMTLREAIGDRAAEPPFLIVSRESIQLNRAADARLDVAEFTTLLELCETHAHRRPESCKTCAERRQQAMALYRDSFLAEFFLPDSASFEEWALLKREALHRLAFGALTQLVRYHERRGEYEEATGWARRQLELEPWREEAHRDVMRLLALAGERGRAIAQYEQCRRVLAEELGAEPEPTTTALYEQIRDEPAEFPVALQHLTLPAVRPHNLPPQPTPFLGREEELARITTLLDTPGCRLVTLVGVGGIGKTRLALQVATEQIETFVDGVYFVSLARLDSADLLVSAIADALDLSLSGRGDSKRELLEALRGREVLLVLDSFEHLLEGAGLLNEILGVAPDAALLVTSRERLNLQTEWIYPVEGLPHPGEAAPEDGEGWEEGREEIEEFGAVQLFLQSARRVHPGFALSPENRPSVARICRLVMGMPLALELAAAWVRVLSCQEIVREIERNLAFLATSHRDVPERHRSVRAVFDQSWELLSPEEQVVFQRLAVFRGGFRREAVEQVAGASLPVLAALVDKSLLRRDQADRHAMHDLVRQYAAEKLLASEEREETRDAHLAFFLDLAERAEPELTGAQQRHWLNRLEADGDNLRAALEWALGGGDAEWGLRLATALYRFWYWHSHLSEGRRWLEAALEAAAAEGNPAATALRARALHAVGVLADEQGDFGRATRAFEASLALRRELGDKAGEASSLNSLGVVAWEQQDDARAEALFEASLALRRRLGETGALFGPLNNLGLVALNRGDDRRAAALFEESLALGREIGDPLRIAAALSNLGLALLHHGDAPRARACFEESLVLHRDVGDKDGVAYCLEGLAAVAGARGKDESARRAARLLGAAETLREIVGAPLSPGERSRHERTVAGVRAALGEEAFEVAWSEGQAMTQEEAITLALRQE